MASFLDDKMSRKVRAAYDAGSIALPPPLAGKGSARWKPGIRHRLARLPLFLLKSIVYLHLSLVLLVGVFCLAYKWVEPPITGIMVYRAAVFGWKASPRIEIKYKDTPGQIVNMLVKMEDGNFYSHPGVSLAALGEAYEVDKKIGKPMYGGSTLSMQLARTLFLDPEKSFLRKYLEIIVALELDFILGKRRVVELYLNQAEWGRGLYGIEAAAVKYFGAKAEDLGVDARIKLVTLLSSPIKYTPATLRNHALLRWRYKYLSDRFAARSVADAVAEAAAKEGAEIPLTDAAESGAAPAPDDTASASGGDADAGTADSAGTTDAAIVPTGQVDAPPPADAPQNQPATPPATDPATN